MRGMFLRAIRETFASHRLRLVLPVGALIGFLVTAFAEGPLQLLALLAAIPLAGYSVSYTRKVIESESPSLPALGDVLAHGRRGIGIIAASLPLALLLLIPPALFIGFAGPESPSLRRVLFAFATFVVMSVVLVAVQARYAYFDKAREAFRYRRALEATREHGAIVALPILVDFLSAGVNLLFRWAAGSALGVQDVRPDTALAAVLDGAAGWSHVALLVVTTLSAVVGFAATLVTAHLIGQFAAVAYADEESSGVALTSASS